MLDIRVTKKLSDFALDAAFASDSGVTALFLSAKPFRTKLVQPPAGWAPPTCLPLGDRVTAREFHDWLYHKDTLARPHPALAGLPTGLLDWDDYGQVIGHDVFDCRLPQAEVVAAAFAVGYCCKGGYDSGVVLAAGDWGRGRIILNATAALAWVGRHPAADRLLLNLIAWGLGTRSA